MVEKSWSEPFLRQRHSMTDFHLWHTIRRQSSCCNVNWLNTWIRQSSLRYSLMILIVTCRCWKCVWVALSTGFALLLHLQWHRKEADHHYIESEGPGNEHEGACSLSPISLGACWTTLSSQALLAIAEVCPERRIIKRHRRACPGGIKVYITSTLWINRIAIAIHHMRHFISFSRMLFPLIIRLVWTWAEHIFEFIDPRYLPIC